MGNLPGVLAVGNVLVRPALVLPHVTVRDIRQLDWRRLHAAGIRGLVFDKDNCLTAPHVDSLAPEIEEAWAEARKVFGPQNILIVSNSAGTTSDPLGVNAEHLSRKLGVPVLCHDAKKPSRACARDVLNYFASVAPGSAQGQLLDAAPKEAGPSTPGPSTRIIVPARPRASLFHPFGRTSQANVHQDQAILVVGDRTMTDVILAHRLDDSLRARHRSASRRSRSALLSPPKATRSETTVGVAAALSGVVRGPGEAEHNSGPPRCISVLTTGLWAHEGRVNDLLRAGEARMTGALRRRGFMPGQRGWRPALRVPERPVVTDGRSAHQADAHADWQALAVRPVPATSSALGPDAAQFAYTHATVPSPVSASENEGAALFLALVLRPLPPAVSRIVLSVARSVPFRSLGLLMSKFGSLFNEGLEQGLNSARSKTMGAVGLRGPFSGRRPRVGPSDGAL